MFQADHTLAKIDPEIAAVVEAERARQESHLELIASENFTSPAVMETQGSVLTNKYAEGYPGRRYYGGCVHVDVAENLAIDRAKRLFGAPFANVQPHSGSQANQGVFHAVLSPGDAILGMDISMGRHLTHGAKVNLSGKLFCAFGYGLDGDGDIDYDGAQAAAEKHRPKLVICGASAFSRRIDFARFRAIADSVGALLLADIAHYAGLVAADLYPNPVGSAHFVTTTTHKTLRGPRGGLIMAEEEFAKAINSSIFPGLQGGPLMHAVAAKAVAFAEAAQPAFREYQKQTLANARALAAALIDGGVEIVSGGTDCHMMLVDLRNFDLNGKEAESALERARITLNKNAIPNDPRPPAQTSGIRIGVPAVTTRGLKEDDMRALSGWILRVLKKPRDDGEIEAVAGEVAALCARHPIYAAAA